MREIKFRVWDKKSKKIFKPMNICFREEEIETVHYADRGGVYLDKHEDYELMQFTGLKDKHGKDIYENDYLEGEGINVWWVKWGSGKYILQNISTGDIIDCNETYTQRQKVTGNSCESPREHKAMETDL